MTLTVTKPLARGFSGSLLIPLPCVAVSGTYLGRLASDFGEVVNSNVGQTIRGYRIGPCAESRPRRIIPKDFAPHPEPSPPMMIRRVA